MTLSAVIGRSTPALQAAKKRASLNRKPESYGDDQQSEKIRPRGAAA